jgi:hypothetical protein
MRTDRELLIECVKQLKHIDEVYDFEPLATTTSLIREVQQALNITDDSNNEALESSSDGVTVCPNRFCQGGFEYSGSTPIKKCPECGWQTDC